MDSQDITNNEITDKIEAIFQLHVMDSREDERDTVLAQFLSTPCNGFNPGFAPPAGAVLAVLSTPCNGFPDTQQIRFLRNRNRILSTPCNGFTS
jgi:hypothetical protein